MKQSSGITNRDFLYVPVLMFLYVVLLTTETIWCGGDGRSSGEAQLVEFSHSGSSQPFPEHGRRQSHDPQTTPDAAREGEGAHPGGGAPDRGGQ